MSNDEADVILVLGTRMNYIIGHAAPPRFNGDAAVVRVDIDPGEIANSPRPLDVGVVADVQTVLKQLTSAIKGTVTPETYATWRERLRGRVPGSAGKLPPASTSLGRGARRLQKSIAGLRGGARGGRGAARPGEAGAARA